MDFKTMIHSVTTPVFFQGGLICFKEINTSPKPGMLCSKLPQKQHSPKFFIY